MRELQVAMVNQKAAEITEIAYPAVTGDTGVWQVAGQVDTDHDGYHVFALQKGNRTIHVPANRLIFVATLVERLKPS